MKEWLFASDRNISLYNRINNQYNFEKRNKIVKKTDTKKVYVRYLQRIGEKKIVDVMSKWYDFNYWFERPNVKNIKFKSLEKVNKIIKGEKYCI